MTDGQTIALFIIILLVDVILSIFIVANEIVNENIYKSNGTFKWSISEDDIVFFGEKIKDKLSKLVDMFCKIRYYV
jgi:hypothetical protein